MFIENLDEENLKKVVKTYNKPEENCPNMITPKCNEETWRGDILNAIQAKGSVTVLQKIQKYTVKAAFAMTDTCDLKSEQCREMITPVIML